MYLQVRSSKISDAAEIMNAFLVFSLKDDTDQFDK